MSPALMLSLLTEESLSPATAVPLRDDARTVVRPRVQGMDYTAGAVTPFLSARVRRW